MPLQGPALVGSKTNKKAGSTNIVVAITCTGKVRRKKKQKKLILEASCVCVCLCWYACDKDAAKCE